MTPHAIRRVLIVCALAAVGWRAIAAQAPPPPPPPPPAPARDAAPAPAYASGTGAIRGVVVSDERTPKPLRRAWLSLRDDRGMARAILSDERGAFAFVNLPSGHYTLSASRPPYVRATYGALTPQGQGLTIALADGQQLDTIRVALAPGAVITGRLVDETGRPITNTRPVMYERISVGGIVSYRVAATGGAVADDHGTYRVFGVAAGTYLIGVVPSFGLSAGDPATPTADELRWATTPAAPGASRAAQPPPPRAHGTRYATVYYPGATDIAQATPVTVAAGEERDGIDLVVRRVPTSVIRGTVTTPDGQPAAAVSVLAVDALMGASITLPSAPMRAVSAPNGTFAVTNVSPGRYVMSARVSRPASPGQTPEPAAALWATSEVEVNGDDVDGVALRLQPGATMSGRVTFEPARGTPLPDPAIARVNLIASSDTGVIFGTPSAPANATGAFTLMAWGRDRTCCAPTPARPAPARRRPGS